jgi:hypothetical protein
MLTELNFLSKTKQRGLNRPHNKTNNMRTKPTLNFTGASLIVSVWHYSATYSRDAVEKIALQHFADVIQIEGGRMDWITQMAFFQDDLIDVLDDCITYHDLQPHQIEQL